MAARASVHGNNNEVDDDSATEEETSDDETDDDESDEETVTSDEDTDSGEEMSSDAASDIGNEEKEAVPIYECSTPYHCIVCSEVVTQDRNPDKPCGRTKYIMDFKKRCRRCRQSKSDAVVVEVFDEKGLTKKGFEVFGVFKVFDEKGFRSV